MAWFQGETQRVKVMIVRAPKFVLLVKNTSEWSQRVSARASTVSGDHPGSCRAAHDVVQVPRQSIPLAHKTPALGII